MQKFIVAAALAATLSFGLAPATANAPLVGVQPIAGIAAKPDSPSAGVTPAAPTPAEREFPQHDGRPDAAPGQARADFNAWLARSPDSRQGVRAFRSYLAANGVDDVVPLWQLVRTSSSWRQCAAGRFEVAPRENWDNIVTTLKFIERDVVPAVGPVQAVSGYRNASLNACSNGAPASAHRHFFALDLMPVDPGVTRGALVRGVCQAHGRDGRSFDTGLGFYAGTRFHVDSSGFRRWGPDGRGATSPCATYS